MSGVDSSNASHDLATGTTRRQWGALALLLLILVLAFALRTYRITEQSVWFDEYNTVVHSTDIPFSEHFAFIQSVNPDHMPFYFFLVYFWSHWVDGSPLSLRLLSVGFSLLTIVLLYGLVRKLHSSRAALFACLCYALSPLHIYFDQGIRYYAFIGFVGVAAILLLYHALERKSLGLAALTGILNALLTWTHLTTALTLPCQGLMLLLGGFGLRRTAAWSLFQMPACAAVLWWLPTMGDENVTWYELPTFMQWLNDLLGDDAVSLSTRSLSQNTTFAFFPESLAQIWIAAHWPFDFAMMGMVALALGSALYYLLKRMRGKPLFRPLSPRDATLAGLLLLALVPFAILSIVSILWEPVLLPRYTLHGSISTYALLGIFLARGSLRFGAQCILIGLVVLYGYQLSLSMTGHTRSNWVGLAQHISKFSRPNDLVIMSEVYDESRLGAGLLRYNMGPSPNAIRQVFSLDGGVTTAAEFLHGLPIPRPGAGRRPVVWLVYQSFGHGPKPELDALIAWHGLRFSKREFTDLTVYRIFGTPIPAHLGADRARYGALRPDLAQFNEDAFLDVLGLQPETPERRSKMIAALRWGHEQAELPTEASDFAALAMLAAEQDLEVALAAAETSIRAMPNESWGHAAIGIVRLLQHDFERSAASFRSSLHTLDNPMLQPLFAALADGDLDLARVHARWFRNSGNWLPPAMYNGLGLSALY